VPPPFFDAVMGSPAEPKSCTVFAPRGGGKTAQKVMIEQASEVGLNDHEFLCLTYDRFILPEGFKARNATLEWHMLNLVRILTAALLVRVQDLGEDDKLDQEQNDFLVKSARTFLYDINVAEFGAIISGMRNWRGKTEDIVKQYGGQIINLISAVAAKFDLGKLELIKGEPELNKPTIMAYFERLVAVSSRLGFSAIYVLVDRIDETSITQNDANVSFEFIQSLVLDLHVLETKSVAFKFFLWDQIRNRYLDAGARTDRIPLHILNWNLKEMSTMLAERLKAYSNGCVASLNNLTDADLDYDVHSLVCILAAGSPRDMIRMCKAIIDEQTRVTNEKGSIGRRVISQGLKTFSDQRARELFRGSVEDLRRVGLASFTISKLANDIFRVSANAISRKIQIWTDQGAVVRTGEVPNPGARPQNLYSLADPRLSIAVKPQTPVESILDRNLFICPGCDGLTIFEEEDAVTCPNCQTPLDVNQSVFKMVGPGL
jgi:hypothetical protein